jgi:hypothetical protein
MKSVSIRIIVNKTERTGLRTEDKIYIFFRQKYFLLSFHHYESHSATTYVYKNINRHDLRVDHRTKVTFSILPEKNISTTSCVTPTDSYLYYL